MDVAGWARILGRQLEGTHSQPLPVPDIISQRARNIVAVGDVAHTE
jgi:hypothetical protein